MQPLIDKYQINPETNKLFNEICTLFDGQPNYQFWAVKVIFSRAASLNVLKSIAKWASEHPSFIKSLSKQNIVSYSTQSQIGLLVNEIKGIDNITTIKNCISRFNTAQRDLLTKTIFQKDFTPLEAYKNETINFYAKKFEKFLKLPMARRNNVVVICSSMTNPNDIITQIDISLAQAYTWEKEDMLSFMENNTHGCEVVFNQGPHVILRIPNFDASKKLCGGGRTQWCITKQDSYFRDYAGSSDSDQYFFFDFSRKETDCFAHVGFTVKHGQGIIYAQTCDNKSMIGEFKQGNETMSIAQLLKSIGVSMSLFMRLKEKCPYDWNMETVLKIIGQHPEEYAIALEKDNRLIINILNNNGLNALIRHTFINQSEFHDIGNNKIYLLLDFNLEPKNDKSIVIMNYAKDQYEMLSLTKMCDVFNNNVTKENYLNTIGIAQDLFINNEAIDPRILLHKYIDEKDELAAIKLIEKEGKSFDINYEFHNRIPAFSAIIENMFTLFETIVNHPKWDSSIKNGFGETLLQTAMYLYSSENINKSSNEEKELRDIIAILLNCEKTNVNIADYNNMTAIHIACTYPKLNWALKSLVSRKNTNVNIVDSYGCSPIINCITQKNLEGLKILGERPDIVITKADEKCATQANINLKDYIKPNPNVFTNVKIPIETINTTQHKEPCMEEEMVASLVSA